MKAGCVESESGRGLERCSGVFCVMKLPGVEGFLVRAFVGP